VYGVLSSTFLQKPISMVFECENCDGGGGGQLISYPASRDTRAADIAQQI